MARGACGLNGFQTVFWPFYAFRSPGRPVNISGQKGGKIGFLMVLEALGGVHRVNFCTPGFSRGKHTQISRGKPRGVKKNVFLIFFEALQKKIGFRTNRKFWLWRARAPNGVIFHHQKKLEKNLLDLGRLWLSWWSLARPGSLKIRPPPGAGLI